MNKTEERREKRGGNSALAGAGQGLVTLNFNSQAAA